MRSREKGLTPVTVVDAVTGAPLMLAYVDEEALRLTAETGLAHFYSRSRGSLWLKGRGSGSVLQVLQVLLDCDGDAAAYVAYTRRHVCHLGRSSCFHRPVADRRGEVLRRLLEETRPYTRLDGDRVLHPLTTWTPPPEPLLAELAAWMVAEHARRRGRPGAVVAPEGAASLLALLAARRLRARLHLARCGAGGCMAPESLGEEDEVVVLARWPEELSVLVGAVEERAAAVSAAIAAAALRGERVDAVLVAEPGQPWPRLFPGLEWVDDTGGSEQLGGGPGEAGVEGNQGGVEG